MDPVKLQTPPLFSLASLLLLLLLLQINSAAVTNTSLTVELIHRDSIHSPLYPGNLTDDQRIRRLVQFSQSHLLSIKSRTMGSARGLTIRPTLNHDKFVYLVRAEIGTSTPPTSLYLMLDTGSNLIWTQTEQCSPCFPQDGPIYDPKTSPTFSPLPEDHPFCTDYNDGGCLFFVRYADGSSTAGILASESFTLESSSGGNETIQGLIFGCSYVSSEEMFVSTRVGGMLGMGRGAQSFAMQVARLTGNRFSYCMVHLLSPRSSYLRFGSDVSLPANAPSTPFLQNPFLNSTTEYYLRLIDISVDGQRLNLPVETFLLRQDGSGGCIIDSGAAVSHLITPAFDAVKRSLMDYFEKLNVPMASGRDIGLDLCYWWSRNFTAYPSMDLHFLGADLHLGPGSLFYMARGGERFCLFMLAADDLTAVGAAQQQNYQFVYDFGREVLSFVPENCAGSGDAALL